jgi:hypothetical protein
MKTCPFCGCRFRPTRANHIYCSERCSRQVSRLRLGRERWGVRRCAVCDCEFVPVREDAIHCGQRCGNKASGRRRRGMSMKARRKEYPAEIVLDNGIVVPIVTEEVRGELLPRPVREVWEL